MSDHKIVPGKYYVAVFLALGVLTVLTVYTAKFVDLGKFNFALAMLIAGVKGFLVISIFMGMYWDKNRLVLVVLSFSFIVFGIFIGITFLDLYTRNGLSQEENFYNRVDTVTSLSVDEEGLLSREAGQSYIATDDLRALQKKIQTDGLQSVLQEAREAQAASEAEAAADEASN